MGQPLPARLEHLRMPLNSDPSPLALALLGLDPSRREPTRALIDEATALGFSAIQLDATAQDLRPRDLDRSSRRDIAALLRRSGAHATGLDLWIPSAHFASPEHQDRALGATRAALELAADLCKLGAMARAVVSIELPTDCPEGILAELRAATDRLGGSIADHAVREQSNEATKDTTLEGLDIGVDPAAILAAGQDPVSVGASAGTRLASARLSDLASSGRVAPLIEGGRLDALAYKVALETAGYHAPPILDLRGVKDPLASAPGVCEAWSRLALGSQ